MMSEKGKDASYELEIEREKVERAEDSIYQGYTFESLSEAQSFIDDIQSNHKKWWSKNLDQIKKINLYLDPEIVLDKDIVPDDADGCDVITAQQDAFNVTLIASTEEALKEFPLISTIVRMGLSDADINNINYNSLQYRRLILDACKHLLDEDFYNDLRQAFLDEGLEI